jgi:hypothetical protein
VKRCSGAATDNAQPASPTAATIHDAPGGLEQPAQKQRDYRIIRSGEDCYLIRPGARLPCPAEREHAEDEVEHVEERGDAGEKLARHGIPPAVAEQYQCSNTLTWLKGKRLRAGQR